MLVLDPLERFKSKSASASASALPGTTWDESQSGLLMFATSPGLDRFLREDELESKVDCL